MSEISAAELLRQAAVQLAEAGVPNAQHDAKRLLLSVLSDPPLSLDQVTLSSEANVRFQKRVARRAKREPLQHILQSASIMYLDLKSDARCKAGSPEHPAHA